MLKKIIPAAIVMALSVASLPALAAIPAGSPQAAEFVQQSLAGVYSLPDRYSHGMVIKDGLLRVDYHPSIGLMVAQNGTALPFKLESVDPDNHSMNLLDKAGRLATFQNTFGIASLIFGDGSVQQMSYVRPMASQDRDTLLRAYMDAGLAVIPGQQPVQAVAGAVKAGFDCGKASTAVERLICSSADLAGLDARVSELYRQVMEYASDDADRDYFRGDQREWLGARNQCGSVECLAGAYAERVAVLELAARQLSKPAEFQ
ncbi:hypothetical protein D9M69_394510 [compost metagenome]